MATHSAFTTAGLRTPGAAAVAGLLFSFLLLAAFVLLRIAVPADPQEPGAWLHTSSGTVALAMKLVRSLGLHSCGLSACCAIVSVNRRTGFWPPCFSAAAFCSSARRFLASAQTGASNHAYELSDFVSPL